MLPPDLAQTSVFFQSRTDAIIAILFSFYFLLLHIKPVYNFHAPILYYRFQHCLADRFDMEK